MISKLLSFLPSWVPLAVIGLLVAGIVGGIIALKHSWQNEAVNGQLVKDASKVIGQQQEDHKTSGTLIEKRDATLTQRDAVVAPVQARIESAPDTSDCPSVLCVDAAGGVRSLIEGYGAGGSPARHVSPN